MRSRVSSLFLSLGLILGLASTAVCGEKVTLRLNLKQGQTFKIAISTRNAGTASVKNGSYGTVESLSLGLAFNVESVDPEGMARMKAVFENVNYSLDQTGASQLSRVMNAFFAGLNGQSFTVEVAPSGEIRSVTGVESAIEAALRSLGDYPDQVRALASAFAGQVLSEPVWRSALAGVFSVLPPEPVEVGERWSRSSSTSTQGAGEISHFYYKILERTNGVAKIKVFTEVKSLHREPMPGVRLMLAGTGEGTVQVDEATGLLIRGSSKSNLKGRVSGAPGVSGEAPVVVTSTTTISRY
ncbi:MAG: DUF6263 family protein [Armatimonadota bacterium]